MTESAPLSRRQRTLRIALALGEAGYLVFPCRPFSKAPATQNGFKDATCDPEQIAAWFDNDRSLNLAVRCGPQPNGINLLAVDIDPKNGGLESWKALCDEHGAPMAPRHETPSGGFHLFFDAPAGTGHTGAHVLGQGIDTRDENGYVVVPPSVLHDDEGEIISYRTSKAAALAENRPHAAPIWLLSLLADDDPPLTASQRRHPSQFDLGDSVADKAREGWQWPIELDPDGWVFGRRRGDQSEWTRPDKSPRDGTSATLHEPDGPFNVYSTSLPQGGVAIRGGGRSYSPWDYIVTFRAGGDTKVAAALVRGTTATSRAGETPPPSVDDTPLYPPPEFYAQRPWLAACQQMAHAVGGSPAAHTLAYLCRWATLIPPGYSIPAINGAPSSFDLLCVIAGTSGAGKTSPMSNAEDMLPVFERKDLRMALGIGSGEGVIEAFYGTEEYQRDDGKTVSERRKIIAGINFSISEGLIFADLAKRGGTTHVTRLCDAWSGTALSTANATAETFRHIDRAQYRLTLMMGIQVDMAHELMTDSAVSQGFVGRLLFAWSEEPRVSPRPDPPDRFVLPVPPPISIPAMGGKPKTYQRVYVEYPPEIYTEIQTKSDQRVGTNVPVEEHHHDLMRCKVAGIVALMDGRMFVSDADWTIATILVECSRAVRLHLYAHRRQQEGAGRHNRAVARAEAEIVVESIKDRQAVARMAEAIRRKVADGAISQRKVARAVSSASTRHRFDAALDLAVSNGWVRIDAEFVEAT